MKAGHRQQPVTVSDEQHTLAVSAAFIRRAALAAARHAGGTRGPISVVIVTDMRMRELNRRFAKVAGTTDVLAFDLSAGPGPDHGPASEIIVNADEAIAQARRRRKSANDELGLYVVHGMLHLCGHDDHGAEERRRMRAAENAVMKSVRRRPEERKPHKC